MSPKGYVGCARRTAARLQGLRWHESGFRGHVCHGSRETAGRGSPGGASSLSDRTKGSSRCRSSQAIAVVLLLSAPALPTRSREARAQHPGPGVVLLPPVEDETGGGRCAVLAMTLNPRVRIVAGSLVLVRVGTQEPRPLAGTATHFHEPPYAIAGWIETSCLVPGTYELH